jgi:hypothetical protein
MKLTNAQTLKYLQMNDRHLVNKKKDLWQVATGYSTQYELTKEYSKQIRKEIEERYINRTYYGFTAKDVILDIRWEDKNGETINAYSSDPKLNSRREYYNTKMKDLIDYVGLKGRDQYVEEQMDWWLNDDLID